ncbi:hypothetical protein F183_A48340 [Bryobacterales bacterium F-183]|nr:hypothetical protein F183_A48340 [Bryobacterales bacterium F-183]
MVPAPRLLWLLALVAFPAAVAGGLVSGWEIIAIGSVTLLALVACADAWLSRNRLVWVQVSAPPLVRLYRAREDHIPLRIDAPAELHSIRLGLPLAEGFDTPHDIRDVLLDASGASLLDWTVTPARRGRYMVEEVYAETSSVLGLWDVRRRVATAFEIRVYPNLRHADALAALRTGALGTNVLRQVGKGREFEKLREYTPGDGYEEIHWKASARRGKPITKVFQVERTQEIYVVIDAGRLSARMSGRESTLERFMEAGLVLGAAAERNGDLFGLAAFSDRLHGFVRARNGKAHYSACRDALYQLEPRAVSPDFDEIATFLRLKLRRRALIVFLTELDDPMLSESFIRSVRLLSTQHVVLAGMLRPAHAGPLFATGGVQTDRDVYARLSAHAAWKGMKETEMTLRRQGVWFSLFTPEAICQQLVNAYAEIKRRQMI